MAQFPFASSAFPTGVPVLFFETFEQAQAYHQSHTVTEGTIVIIGGGAQNGNGG